MTAAAPEASAMLAVWDAGQGRSLSTRALALLAASVAEETPGALAAWPVGARDAALLKLHDGLFGDAVECWLACPACRTNVEVNFRTGDVRAPLATATTVEVDVEGVRIAARLPNSSDLLTLEREIDPARAERRLFERCVVTAERDGAAVAPAALPAAAVEVVGAALAAADPQAEVLLDLACPECATAIVAPFDIGVQLWARLDHWARAMLTAIDAIAARYGWSEAAILALTPTRRQAYLDVIASAR